MLQKPIISLVFTDLFTDIEASSVSYCAGYSSVEGHILHLYVNLYLCVIHNQGLLGQIKPSWVSHRCISVCMSVHDHVCATFACLLHYSVSEEECCLSWHLDWHCGSVGWQL